MFLGKWIKWVCVKWCCDKADSSAAAEDTLTWWQMNTYHRAGGFWNVPLLKLSQYLVILFIHSCEFNVLSASVDQTGGKRRSSFNPKVVGLIPGSAHIQQLRPNIETMTVTDSNRKWIRFTSVWSFISQFNSFLFLFFYMKWHLIHLIKHMCICLYM